MPLLLLLQWIIVRRSSTLSYTNSPLKVYTKNLRKNHISKFLLDFLYTF